MLWILEKHGFKQVPFAELEGMTKEQIAKKYMPKEAAFSFDYALPQQWLDELSNFAKDSGYTYHQILGTTYMIYGLGLSIYGAPWSACKEIDDLIAAFNGR